MVLNRVTKAAPVHLLQAELNNFCGFVLKLTGDSAAVESAVAVAAKRVDGLGKLIAAHVITTLSEAVMRLVKTVHI